MGPDFSSHLILKNLQSFHFVAVYFVSVFF